MIQVNIIKVATGEIGWFSQFPDQDSANAWINQERNNASWGKQERDIASNDPRINSEDITKATGSTPSVINGQSVIIYTFGPDFQIQQIDVTAQVALKALVNKGLQAQQVGAQIVAQVYAYNEQNLASGALTTQEFQAMLADATLANVERLLWNGSLATALALVNADSSLSTYFSADQIAAVKAAIQAGIS
jgi:hypothetical protein